MSVYGNDISTYLENTFLNEAFVGKTPILEEISKKFQSIIDAGPKGYYKNLSRDKRIIEINRLFEKQFGMEVCSIRVTNSAELNAYTLAAAIRTDVVDKFDDFYNAVGCNPSSGYYFKKGNNICVVLEVNTGLIYCGLNGEELTAVLLHEIGHNFADALYGDIYVANKEFVNYMKEATTTSLIIGILLSPALIGIPMVIDAIKAKKLLSSKSYAKEAKKNDKNAGKLTNISTIISGIKNQVNDYLDYVEELGYRLADYTGVRIDDPLKGRGKKRYESYKGSLARINEVFADKFATMYGYGPELQRGLGIFHDYLSRANKEIQFEHPESDKTKNLKYEELYRKEAIFDEHPRFTQRINTSIHLLERELKKDDLDPKYKKMLEDQYKQLKDILKEYTTCMDKLSKNDNARRLYNAYINNNLPDAVDAEIEEKIEEALDKGFNDYKKNNKK